MTNIKALTKALSRSICESQGLLSGRKCLVSFKCCLAGTLTRVRTFRICASAGISIVLVLPSFAQSKGTHANIFPIQNASTRLNITELGRRELPSLKGFETDDPSDTNLEDQFKRLPLNPDIIGWSGIPLVKNDKRLELVSSKSCADAMRIYAPKAPHGINAKNEEVRDFVKNCYLPSSSGPGWLRELTKAVVLIGEGDTSHCTGFLLESRVVLTAAHCLSGKRGLGTNGVSTVLCDRFWVRTAANLTETAKVSDILFRGASMRPTTCSSMNPPNG